MVLVEFTCLQAHAGATITAKTVDFGRKEELGKPGQPVYREEAVKWLIDHGFRVLWSQKALGANGGSYKFWEIWGRVYIFGDLDQRYQDKNAVKARYEAWCAEQKAQEVEHA